MDFRPPDVSSGQVKPHAYYIAFPANRGLVIATESDIWRYRHANHITTYIKSVEVPPAIPEGWHLYRVNLEGEAALCTVK